MVRSVSAALLAALILYPSISTANPAAPHSGSSRPDAHAPIGVMGDHTHAAGEWMLSYRYARMKMAGNRKGSDRLSLDQILAPPAGTGSYMVSPTEMDMQMHMFGAMFAPFDWITLMAMIGFVELDMDHVSVPGARFTTSSDGVSDLSLSGLVPLFERGEHRLHANLGISFPTGSIDHRDDLPTGNAQLPYPMQIGSGSYDFVPGVTYNGRSSWLSFGSQILGTVRMNDNDNGYRLGNRVDTTAWLACEVTSWLSVSGRASWSWWDDIHGSDSRLTTPASAVPTADPDLRGGNRLDLLPGFNVLIPAGPLKGHRFAFEVGFPVYQNLDGPQLETDWRLVAGWQKAF